MELQDLKRTALACVLAVVFCTGVVTGDVESTLARCCVLGANWAREAEGCAKFPTPVAGEASEHQSICLTAAAICCLRFYREQQCEAGKAAAQRGQDCRLPAVEGGEYYKDCCEGCKLGLVSGSMAFRCAFRSLQFGMPWDAAYTACCTQLHPDLPALPSAVVGAAGTDNAVLYPGSRAIADSENLCLLFPGQLCAHVCVPAPGSYTCQCRAGFTLSVDGKTCLQDQQADRCAEYDACEHICRDTGVSIECDCKQGYQLQRDQRSCADVDECSLGLHSCMPGEQVCFNQKGTYACVNPDGSLISPWVPPLNPPEGPGAVGITLGGVTDESEAEGRTGNAGTTNSYYLGSNVGRCPPGYKYNTVSEVCDDVDECVTVQGLCGRDGLCTNTIGSYTCTRMPHDTCPPGYHFDMALQSCLDIDECIRLTDNCDRSTQFCLNTLGGFVCEPKKDSTGSCPAGYKYNANNSECEDVDECAEGLSVCREDEVCRNAVGAYDCEQQCDEGFQFSAGLQSCVDIDECRAGVHTCSPGTKVCVNEPGGFRCDDLRDTTRLDEGSPEHDRGEGTEEGLTPGTLGTSVPPLVRECSLGFGYDFSSGQCLDIDECQGEVHNCSAAAGERCINTLGSFRCRRRRRCPPGYNRGAGGECVDVDECSDGGRAVCLPGQVCINTNGSFECQVECRDGFTYDPSHPMTCADIDECSGPSPCPPSYACFNNEGSFVCRAPSQVEGSTSDPQKSPHSQDGSPRLAPGGSPSRRPEDGESQFSGSSEGRRAHTNENASHMSTLPTAGQLSAEDQPTTPSLSDSVFQSCPAGYLWASDTGRCEDEDECQTGRAHCLEGEVCLNHPGGYRCRVSPHRSHPSQCPAGHRFSHKRNVCEDINECEERLDTCSASTQTCINSVGGYRCIDSTPTCAFGYRYDPTSRDCLDINECLEGRDFCDALTERCTNLPGGYRCEHFTLLHQPRLPVGKNVGVVPPHSFKPFDPFTPPDPVGPAVRPPLLPLPPPNSNQPIESVGRDNRQFIPPSPPPLPPRPDLLPASAVTNPSMDASIINTTFAPTTETPAPKTATTSIDTVAANQSLPHHKQTPSPFGASAEVITGIDPIIDSLPDVSTSTTPSAASSTHVSPAVPCPPGFAYDAKHDICRDEDECLASLCAPGQRCRNLLGSYRCECEDGFKIDPATGSCRDINECQLGSYNCDDSQRCDNTVGSYTCVRIAGCGTGYTLNHNTGLCEDNDECESGRHDCDQLGPQWLCVNTKGSFRCEKKSCPDLEFLDDLGTCVKITCPAGYRPEMKSCVDIDECAEPSSSPCRRNEHCINLQGSHTCQPRLSCGRGYHMNEDGTNCVDIDECATTVHECRGGQTCINRPGAYACQCPPGYRLNHLRQCQDVDECTSFYEATCSNNADCENTPGSFICHCHQGFRKAEGGRSCVDIDECSSEHGVCHHRCINIRGGYQCLCNAGYSIARDNRTCVDIDECEETKGRGRWRLCVGVCENTPGSFQCACPPGYTLASDLRTCKDTNECASDDACQSSHEQCINTRGGFRCMEIACPPEYIRDTSHKSRCKKKSLYCRRGDLECAEQPLSYSYNFLPLVSNMTLPSTGQVDLFTMRGPLWSTSTVHFALDLESVRAPASIEQAKREFFRLRKTSGNQAIISLIHTLVGPQEVQLALSMKLYHENVYSGSAVAKLLLIISEYDF